MHCRFDYYSAGIPADPSLVVGQLASRFDLADVQPSRPLRGYSDGLRIATGDKVHGTLWWGGSGGKRVLAFASGDSASSWSDAVRSEFPEHLVIRADVAADLVGDDTAWETLEALALSIADRKALKVCHHGDFHRGEDGRTINLGSRQSAAMLRLYEKGKQLGIDPTWVRAELEVKPQTTQAREYLATAEPIQFWGCSPWATDFAGFLFGEYLDRIAVSSPKRASDLERSFSFMLKQYGSTVHQMAAIIGWDGVLQRFKDSV
jgi:DNA relaxase NicK